MYIMFWNNTCDVYSKSPPDFTPQILSTKTITDLDSVNNIARVTISVEGNFFRNKNTRVIINGSIAIPDQNVLFINTNHLKFILPRDIRFTDIQYFQLETVFSIENRAGKQDTILRSPPYVL